MTVSTYGEHAENSAQALNALIRDDVIPADEHAVDQLLYCREAVVDALRQRLYDVGQDCWYPPPDHVPAWIAPGLVEGWLCRLGGCRAVGRLSVVAVLELGGRDVAAVAVKA